eukprot:4262572-Pyramimonas_sp.AAC.1
MGRRTMTSPMLSNSKGMPEKVLTRKKVMKYVACLGKLTENLRSTCGAPIANRKANYYSQFTRACTLAVIGTGGPVKRGNVTTGILIHNHNWSTTWEFVRHSTDSFLYNVFYYYLAEAEVPGGDGVPVVDEHAGE